MRPIFAKGKSEVCETTGSIEQGATEIPVADADQHFTSGDLIFLADADFGDVECPGFAESVSTSSITVHFGVKNARVQGANVWKPATFFQWEIGRSSPFKRSYLSGTEILKTTGGVIYSTKIADSQTVEHLTFDRVTVAAFSQYETWVKETTNDGLYSFTYVDEARDVVKVRILNPGVERLERSPGLVELGIELGIEENQMYE